VGDTVELGDVLLIGAEGDIMVGAPTVAGARVLGTIAEQGRARKIVVFRYKAKTRSRKKTGHRQQFTKVIVDDILAAGQEPKPKAAPVEAEAEAPAKGRRSRRARATVEPESPPAGETAEPVMSAPDAAAVDDTPEAETPDAEVAGAEDALPEADSATEAPGADEAPEAKPKRSRRKAE
jgi:large subunit ribosomal protein L21